MIMPSLISFLLYVCFVAVWLGLTDINDVLLGSTEEWLRSFLFLPHAVRVLSAVTWDGRRFLAYSSPMSFLGI